MHRKIVAGISAILFGLLTLVALIVADMTDRSLPTGLETKAAVSLDFARSDLQDLPAFTALTQQSRSLGLGLVKVAPDLSGGPQDRAFISLERRGVNEPVASFRPGDRATLRGSEYLARSYPTGQYLVTGPTADTAQFRSWLTAHRVQAHWTERSVGTTAQILVRQGEFAVALIGAVALLVGVVLYWLTVLARGRALRVLAGAPVRRVQAEDLAGVLLPVLAVAAVCTGIAAAVVAARSGAQFLPDFLQTSAAVTGPVLLATAALALLMATRSLPAPESLARREPGLVSLRRVSAGLKLLTFCLVLWTAAPALAAYQQASQAAQEQGQWRKLSQQARLVLSSEGGEAGFQRRVRPLGKVIAAADADREMALSYAWSPTDAKEQAGVSLDTTVAIVNDTWLHLMGKAVESSSFERVPAGSEPAALSTFLGPNLDLWRRTPAPGTPLEGLQLWRYRSSNSLPVGKAGSGELLFPDDALVLVLPRSSQFFNDDFLGSLVSSGNISFTGLDATATRVRDAGLGRDARVVYAAEEGVLRAQYATYFAWLRGAAFVATLTALLISVIVSALIAAVISVRRDFALRLNGTSPWALVVNRLGPELALIVGFALLLITLRAGEGKVAAFAVALAACALAPVAHLAATRWAFGKAVSRSL